MKRIFISLIFAVMMVFFTIACSGSKKLCPAYSVETTQQPVAHKNI
jgi:hypothetical protein